ncbi:MAG: YceI family protein [Actinomycetota bacterium]
MSPVVKRVVVVVAAVVLAVVGVPWVYINVVKDDAPDVLSLDTTPTTIDAASTTVVADDPGVDGQWNVLADSVVGYRVKEILFGQSTEGVGRTSAVTGSLTIESDTVAQARFDVDMATLTSDSDRRDRQVRGRILETSSYPTASFVLGAPISLTPEALAGNEFAVDAVGTLTLRGVTKDVAVALVARFVDGVIEVNGSLQIVFAEWSIPDPSISAISVEDRGVLEFLLRFGR